MNVWLVRENDKPAFLNYVPYKKKFIGNRKKIMKIFPLKKFLPVKNFYQKKKPYQKMQS